MKKYVRYLVQGLLITVPLSITLLIVVKIIRFVGGIFTSYGIIVHPFIDPFIVIVAALLLIIAVGFMGTSLFFQPLKDVFENAIEKVKPLHLIYTSTKDLLGAFMGTKKSFNKPVLVDIDKQNGIQQIGFITQQDLTHMGIEGKKVSVYIPYSYTFSGRLMIVPAESVTPLNVNSADALKFALSGGVSEMEEKGGQ